MLEGEAGIGKTAVLREIVDRAATRGYAVLLCRPAEVESKLSFVSLGDLLAGVREDTVRGLPDPQRRALEGALLLREPEGPAIDPRAVSAAVLSTLAVVARERPTVVVIDDAQWLDAPSARALGFAARRVDSDRIGILIAVRAGGCRVAARAGACVL